MSDITNSPEILNGPSPEQLAVTQLSDLVSATFDKSGVTETHDVLNGAYGKPRKDHSDLAARINGYGDLAARIDVHTLDSGTTMRRVHLDPTMYIPGDLAGDSLTEYTDPDGTMRYILTKPGIRTPEQRIERDTFTHVYEWTKGDDKVHHIRTHESLKYEDPSFPEWYAFEKQAYGSDIINEYITDVAGINDVTEQVKNVLTRIPENRGDIRDHYRGIVKDVARSMIEHYNKSGSRKTLREKLQDSFPKY